MKTIEVWVNDPSDYELIDSGDKQKLEKVGNVLMVRSEPRAWWKPTLPQAEWDKAAAMYTSEEGQWQFNGKVLKDYPINIAGLRVKINFAKTSKHFGVFPEQAKQWEFIRNKIKAAKREVNVLNLFGYTGLATLAAASAGATVTHVDASKTAVTWARENQNLSGLTDAPVRWIVDDVIKYVRREGTRGKKYDAIILDPPAFGRGAQGQVWKIEKDLRDLLELCKNILSDNPLFIFMTTYSIDASSLAVGNLLEDLMAEYKGTITVGEMALTQKSSDKLLPMSIFAVWQA